MRLRVVPQRQQLRLGAVRQRLVRSLLHCAEAAVELVAGPVEGILRIHTGHLGDLGGHEQGVSHLFPDTVGNVGGLSVLQGGQSVVHFLLCIGKFLFCLCQFGCSVFSTCSITVIQARTPETLMGKVMSFVFTLSMCAQPVGQIVYGALFDRFAGDPHRVLLPSGAVVCLIGLASVPFFVGLERRAPLREAGNKEPADGSREGLSAGKEG